MVVGKIKRVRGKLTVKTSDAELVSLGLRDGDEVEIFPADYTAEEASHRPFGVEADKAAFLRLVK